MLPHEVLIYSLVSAVLLLAHENMADDVIIQKRVYDTDLAAMFDPKRKKPFCNAFTGCGRKRSDESMATLVEMNSEPAVEELSRQIMSEAKNWETIQEARLEILRNLPKDVEPNPKIAHRPFSLTGLKNVLSV